MRNFINRTFIKIAKLVTQQQRRRRAWHDNVESWRSTVAAAESTHGRRSCNLFNVYRRRSLTAEEALRLLSENVILYTLRWRRRRRRRFADNPSFFFFFFRRSFLRNIVFIRFLAFVSAVKTYIRTRRELYRSQESDVKSWRLKHDVDVFIFDLISRDARLSLRWNVKLRRELHTCASRASYDPTNRNKLVRIDCRAARGFYIFYTSNIASSPRKITRRSAGVIFYFFFITHDV